MGADKHAYQTFTQHCTRVSSSGTTPAPPCPQNCTATSLHATDTVHTFPPGWA